MQKCDLESLVSDIRAVFDTQDFIPLHAPVFSGNEKKYVLDTIDSTFVSSVGDYVTRFESDFAAYVGSRYAVATMNGTSALHIALVLAGVDADSEVITQSLTFVATCNAIRYCSAYPTFIDVSKDNLGLCPEKLKTFLESSTKQTTDGLINTQTGRVIKACLPMHTFGHPAQIDAICAICADYGIPVIEDAAEALGSRYNDKHCGSVSTMGVFSFNGNKILTTGGGGMLVTDNEALAKKAKHISTTAKVPHAWNYDHDQVAFNYRMPNLNAALGCAQLEQLPVFIEKKRQLASRYKELFETKELSFLSEPAQARSNYWLNALLFKTQDERDIFLTMSNEQKVMTRPVWTLMHKLPMFKSCYRADVSVSEDIETRLVNIPSSVIL